MRRVKVRIATFELAVLTALLGGCGGRTATTPPVAKVATYPTTTGFPCLPWMRAIPGTQCYDPRYDTSTTTTAAVANLLNVCEQVAISAMVAAKNDFANTSDAPTFLAKYNASVDAYNACGPAIPWEHKVTP